jgi:uncharacterized Zn finger protein (UPF0148 family)
MKKWEESEKDMYYQCNHCKLEFEQERAFCPVCGKKLKEKNDEVRFLEADLLLKPKAGKKELAEKYKLSEENIHTVYFPYWNIGFSIDQDVVYTLETVKDGISSMKTAFVHVEGELKEKHYEAASYKKELIQYLKKGSFEEAVEYDEIFEDETVVLARDTKSQKGKHVHQIVTELLTGLGEKNEELLAEGRPVCDTIADYEVEECSVVLVPVYFVKEKGRKCIIDAQSGEMLSDNKPKKKSAVIEIAAFVVLTVLYGVIQYFLHYNVAVTIGYILIVFVSAMVTSVPEDVLEKTAREDVDGQDGIGVAFEVKEIVEGQKELGYFE